MSRDGEGDGMSHLIFKQYLEAKAAKRSRRLSKTQSDLLVSLSLASVLVAQILITLGGNS